MNAGRVCRWAAAAAAATGMAAAAYAAAAPAEQPEAAAPPSPAGKAGQVEVCFVLDTTGSMGGLIEGAKRKIWSIANSIASARPTPKVRFGLIGYRDRGDAYVTKAYDLTDNIDDIYDKLQQFRADGGGDGPESVNQALNEAVTKMAWNTNREVLKIVFLVGDAPPHMDYADDVKYPDTCQDAVRRDLIINTIQCGTQGDTTPVWQDIANRSEGAFAAIGQSGDMVVVKTPMDEEIAKLNVELASTRFGYGAGADRYRDEAGRATAMAAAPMAPDGAERALFLRRKAEAKAREYDAAAPAARPAMAEAVRAGDAELLTAVDHGVVKLDELEEDKLPEEIRKLGKEERQKYIDGLLAKRKVIEARLKELGDKRATFLDEERKKAAASGAKDGFDTEVGKIIREQGKRKGLVYE